MKHKNLHLRLNTQTFHYTKLHWKPTLQQQFWVFTTPLTSQAISVALYSERQKSDKFCSEALFRLEVLLRAVNLRHGGLTALRPFRRKSYSGFLRFEKIHRLRPGLNPRTLDAVASMITTGPPGSTGNQHATICVSEIEY